VSALWPINSAVSEAESNLRAQVAVTGEVFELAFLGITDGEARR
jgi:hypothetical protein